MTAEQLRPGAIVGRDFRVEKRIAAGGMGTVYEVAQLSTGKRRALKIMHAQYEGDDRARERFIQEARAGASIDSDHIVEMVAAGIDDASGTPYIAMELLQGKDLKSVQAERGALSREEVREVCKQLLHGIAAAHRMGLVHRDLKPENIFLAVPRREGIPFTVKVLDFGIAKLVQEGATSATHTQAIGSPRWMAPEQAERGGKITPATDVWSLGLIVFALLTGKSYWRTANSPAPSVMQQMCEVLMEPIVPASERAAEFGVGNTIPPGFDAWFARCVARDPFERFQDGSEVLGGLLPLLGSTTVAPTMATPAPVPVAAPLTDSAVQRNLSTRPPSRTREVRLDAVIPRDETPGSLDASLPSGSLASRRPSDASGPSNKLLIGIAGVALASVVGVFAYTRTRPTQTVTPTAALSAVDAGAAVPVVAVDAGAVAAQPAVDAGGSMVFAQEEVAAADAGHAVAAPAVLPPHVAGAQHPGTVPGQHPGQTPVAQPAANGRVLPPSIANAVARLADAGARPAGNTTTPAAQPAAEPGGVPFHARVMQLMQSHQSDFIQCYERGTGGNQEIAGRLAMYFTVGLDGRAADVRTRGLDAAPEVGTCAAGVVRSITFPPGGPGAGELVHTINFRREVAQPTPPPAAPSGDPPAP